LVDSQLEDAKQVLSNCVYRLKGNWTDINILTCQDDLNHPKDIF